MRQDLAAEMLEPEDRRVARRATGLLASFNRVGLLEAADVHVASRLGALGGEERDQVLLAVALAVRAARTGAVCVDLAAVADQPSEQDPAVLGALDWPEAGSWAGVVAASPLTEAGVLRVEESLLYLDRHWREERQVCEDLLTRGERKRPEVDEALLAGGLERLFPPGWDLQRVAAERAARCWTSVLTGGPGTGKTASVARIVALIGEQFSAAHGRPPRVALAAPTGKAAARLQESVAGAAADLAPGDADRLDGLRATTVHRLLGWRPDSSTRFRHQRSNPLPFDLVVVDEVSMVSLSQMARLLEAVRPTTRLLLVGDPDQLASVEAGAVLADVVAGLGGQEQTPVTRLTEVHRTDGTAELDDLAAALRLGDADRVLALLGGPSPAVALVDPADEEGVAAVRHRIADAAAGVARSAAAFTESESAADLLRDLERHRLLCAHREGPFGVAAWNQRISHEVSELTEVPHYDEWYPGRPVLVTANDRGLGVSNGDVGVVVRLPDGRLRVLLRTAEGSGLFAPTRLSGLETVYAMTVHKSQGSEAAEVTVVLPEPDSPLLTRELFYTAVTRARERVRVVGTEESVRAAVERRVQRASGLARRLREGVSARSR